MRKRGRAKAEKEVTCKQKRGIGKSKIRKKEEKAGKVGKRGKKERK